MKITIAKEEFIRGLQSVQNVVNPRTTLPVLSNVLLEANDGKLLLTATDLDVTVSCTVKADVSEEGRVTLPAKKLFGIVRELSTPEIELNVDDKQVCSLHAGASFFKIVGLAANEFPPLPGFQEAHRITISQERLRGMIKKTAYAVSSEESRYVLNGIFFSIKEFKLTLVATDGRRLALIEEELEEKPEVQEQFIVPTKAINELNRLLNDGGTVLVQFQDNQASFHLEGGWGLYAADFEAHRGELSQLRTGHSQAVQGACVARSRRAASCATSCRDHDQRQGAFGEVRFLRKQSPDHRQHTRCGGGTGEHRHQLCRGRHHRVLQSPLHDGSSQSAGRR